MSSVWLSVPSPAGDHDHHLDRTRRRAGGEVEQRAALGVEPDQQPAGALDEHRVVAGERPRSGAAYDATAGSSTPCAPGGGVGGERLVERRSSS